MEGTMSLNRNCGGPAQRRTTTRDITAPISVAPAYKWAHVNALWVELANTSAATSRSAVGPTSSCVYFLNCSLAANALEQIAVICLPNRSEKATDTSIGSVAEAGSTTGRMQIANTVKSDLHTSVTRSALPT